MTDGQARTLTTKVPARLGRLSGSFGRKPMTAGTYLVSGLLLLIACLFDQDALRATTMTACWCAVLFSVSVGTRRQREDS